MKTVFSIDRIEGNIAVCVSDDGVTVQVPVSVIGEMRVRDVFSATVEGDDLLCVEPMPEERERRIATNRARLHALTKRGKEHK